MENLFKISVPKPCHKNWDQMKPTENGRFCESCSKNVVDFTNMDRSKIQEYFLQNKAEQTCGRFNAHQVDNIIITIPKRLILKQLSFRKSFLLALFITMGTTLFSCTDANGKRQNIDKIEVTDSKNQHRTMGLPLPPKNSGVTSENTQPTSANQQAVKGKMILCPTKIDTADFSSGDTISE